MLPRAAAEVVLGVRVCVCVCVEEVCVGTQAARHLLWILKPPCCHGGAPRADGSSQRASAGAAAAQKGLIRDDLSVWRACRHRRADRAGRSLWGVQSGVGSTLGEGGGAEAVSEKL